ncbi:hypothetical protein HDU93_001544 [Gonapodya sp. JEL0774]|nr:hypothetical protein HDU93_001544 [Gonapodya sp. JEL0774]
MAGLEESRTIAIESRKLLNQGRRNGGNAQESVFDQESVVICHAYDASEEGASRRLISTAVSVLGGLDVVVLNHGMTTTFRVIGSGPEKSMAAVEKVAKVNFLSVVEAALFALPHLQSSADSRAKTGKEGLKGTALKHWVASRLVAISSFSAKIPSIKVNAYAAAKAAMTHYFANLRLELDHHPKYKNLVTLTVPLLGPVSTATYLGAVAKDHPTLLKFPGLLKHLSPAKAAELIVITASKGLREPALGTPRIVVPIWGAGGFLSSALEWVLIQVHGGFEGSVAPSKEEAARGED